MHWDYESDREAPWGLTRAATVVDSLRRVHPGQVILVDGGDLLQGNPFAAYFATVRRIDPHPIVEAMEALSYDAAVPGNHEFDFGLEFLERATAGAKYRILAANVLRLPERSGMYLPAAIVERGGVRVGIAGFTTPGVMVWNGAHLRGRVVVEPILPHAARTLRDLQLQGAHLKVALIHSGLQGGSSYDTLGVGAENVAATLVGLPVKPDLVVVGHSHRRLRDSVIQGVHFVQPDPWARSLSVVHVVLIGERAAGRWEVNRIAADLVSLQDVRPDPVITRRFAWAHEEVRAWTSQPIGTTLERWSARYARVEDTPIIDFINWVQQSVTGAQLSATAAFNLQAGFGAGAIRLADVVALYPYENTLKAVKIDGGTLKWYLERSALYFRTFRPQEPVVNDSIPGYNFDIVSGVSYSIDLSRPPGSRIQDLQYRGRPVLPTDTFTLALNSYRQAGGGGYDRLRELPVVYDRGEGLRDLLVEAIRRAGELRSSDYFEPSWQLLPPQAREAARRVFSK
jgi:2',3'-cyclic-nucleotide 2'-phosphodiesterase/3'-nucleotidase